MTEQLLDHAQIRSAIKEMCRERMAERMWMDLSTEPCAVCRIANHTPRRLASQAHATLREKECTRLHRSSAAPGTRLRVNLATAVAIRSNRINSWFTDWNHTLSPALPKESYAPFLKIHSIKIQCDNLAHASPRSVERLAQCVRALRISTCKIAFTLLGRKFTEQPLYTVQPKHCWEIPTRTRQINLRADCSSQLAFTLRESVQYAECGGAAAGGGNCNIGPSEPRLGRLRIGAPSITRSK